MQYTSLIRKALEICYQAHQGQLDQSGTPYVFHPYHLAEQMDTEESVCVALLHDVLEDASYTGEDLLKEGFPEQVVSTVELLTRTPGVPYMDYIRSLKGNELACRIKRADLEHNSDMSRLPRITDRDIKRTEKYREAIRLLSE